MKIAQRVAQIPGRVMSLGWILLLVALVGLSQVWFLRVIPRVAGMDGGMIRQQLRTYEAAQRIDAIMAARPETVPPESSLVALWAKVRDGVPSLRFSPAVVARLARDTLQLPPEEPGSSNGARLRQANAAGRSVVELVFAIVALLLGAALFTGYWLGVRVPVRDDRGYIEH